MEATRRLTFKGVHNVMFPKIEFSYPRCEKRESCTNQERYCEHRDVLNEVEMAVETYLNFQ
jgi:hypothetical protein